MSNKSRLQTNNTNLQALINKANALPDAGGNDGESVKTCNLAVTRGVISSLAYISVDEHNQIVTVIQEGTVGSFNLTAICGSCFVVYSTTCDFSSSDLTIDCWGCSLVYAGQGIIVGKITAEANDSATLTVNMM